MRCEHLKSAYQRANISTEVGSKQSTNGKSNISDKRTTAQGAHGRHCIDDFARVRTLAPDGDSLTTLCTARTAPDWRTRNAHISHTSSLTCFTDDTARGIARFGGLVVGHRSCCSACLHENAYTHSRHFNARVSCINVVTTFVRTLWPSQSCSALKISPHSCWIRATRAN